MAQRSANAEKMFDRLSQDAGEPIILWRGRVDAADCGPAGNS
jgi:hypothetical protein